MRREGHDGRENIFTPSAVDGVGPCEKIYIQTQNLRQVQRHFKKRNIQRKTSGVSATGDVCGSGQGEDQGSVQFLRLGRQNRLGVIQEARELGLDL